jgi:hypothetical protein
MSLIVQVFGRRHDEPFHALWRPASKNLHNRRQRTLDLKMKEAVNSGDPTLPVAHY